LTEVRVLIKGAGDLATGVAYRLHRAGLEIVMTDLAQPTAIRRTVAFAEAIYDGEVAVEGLRARRVDDVKGARRAQAEGVIPVLVDPEGKISRELRLHAVVDARMAKRNLGTQIDEAPAVIGLGPGFRVGRDVHAVVETLRGHFLGRVLLDGEAVPPTGEPGEVGGESERRILRAPAAGVFRAFRRIGDVIAEGDAVAQVDGQRVTARLPGVLRGALHDGLNVRAGMKVGDVDPRGVREYCFTISDKALAVAGGVLEASLYLRCVPAHGAET
jgi:xanthine dehydrogenase accessory factor